jgi:hypothetical protein
MRLGILIGAVGTLLILAIIVVIARQSSSEAAAVCADPETRDRIRALSLRAYDEAFVEHVAKLFVIWVQDPHEQPRRAQTGNQQAISAYIRARNLAMKWEPPACDVPLPSSRPN